MSQEELLLEYWHELPPEHQRELINFAEFLRTKVVHPQPRPNIKGLCADLNINLTLDDFTQARKETWDTLPRERFYT